MVWEVGGCGPFCSPLPHTHTHGYGHTAAMLSQETEKALFYHPVKNLGARLGNFSLLGQHGRHVIKAHS